MDTCKTIKVKPWGKDQGDFVEINADDFEPTRHKKFGEPEKAEPKAEAHAAAAPAAKPVKRPARKGKGAK